MPSRLVPLVSEQFYHVVNRGVDRQRIFISRRDNERFLEILFYYQFKKTPVKYSRFNALPHEEKTKILSELETGAEKLVTLISYCIMPNHFHILLKQLTTDGISIYLGNIQNSYAKYFNKKTDRTGHLFQGPFRAVRIENDNQLIHTSRYIHLNPYSSYLVKNERNLLDYPWSSLTTYLENEKGDICDPESVLSLFPTPQNYKNFVLDQKDYQRSLQSIKHLTLD